MAMRIATYECNNKEYIFLMIGAYFMEQGTGALRFFLSSTDRNPLPNSEIRYSKYVNQ